MENSTKTNVKAKYAIPCLTYNDAPSAIEWLCEAFGFEKGLIVPGKNGTIQHSQLKLGNIMIMVGSQQKDTPYSKLTKTPGEVGDFVTQSPYVVIDDKDIDEHYENAKKHGAKMVIDLKEEDYGGKGYTCYDIEGHIWNFGSYDPYNLKR